MTDAADSGAFLAAERRASAPPPAPKTEPSTPPASTSSARSAKPTSSPREAKSGSTTASASAVETAPSTAPARAPASTALPSEPAVRAAFRPPPKGMKFTGSGREPSREAPKPSAMFPRPS